MPRKLIGVLQTSGMRGPQGPEGKPGPEGVAGKGFPVGGLANQILAKKSDADYDTEWIDNNAKGNVESVNGKTGQVTLTAEDVGATTEQWVNQQNYLKSIPSEYITETELNAKGYLTEIPSEYVTETELESKGYLTEHQSLANYSTTEEMNNAISNHHDSTKQDTLTAGDNITIQNNVISATGGGSGSSLPEYPTTNGNYSLIAVIKDGISSLSWKSVASIFQLPTQMANDLKLFQAVTINKINNKLEVY